MSILLVAEHTDTDGQVSFYTVKGSKIILNPHNDGDDTVIIDNPEVLVNGVPKDNFGPTFHRQYVPADEAAASLVRSFINDDPEFVYKKATFKIRAFRKTFFTGAGIWHNDKEIPETYLGEYNTLQLQMIDYDDLRYYSDGNEFVMIRTDGSKATDMEALYENSFIEAYESNQYIYATV